MDEEIQAEVLVFLYDTQQEPRVDGEILTGPFYMKQTVDNACGTIAMVHALLNCQSFDPTQPGVLSEFYNECIELSPDQRAEVFSNSQAISSIHSRLAQQGQSEVPEAEDDISLHFVALVPFKGHLWLLDGRKDGPLRICPVETNWTMPAFKLIKDAYMHENLKYFSLIALM